MLLCSWIESTNFSFFLFCTHSTESSIIGTIKGKGMIRDGEDEEMQYLPQYPFDITEEESWPQPAGMAWEQAENPNPLTYMPH